MGSIDLVWFGDAPPTWPHGEVYCGGDDLPSVAALLNRAVAQSKAPWLLLWSAGLAVPEPEVLAALVQDRVDCWHAGLCCGLEGLPREHDYIQPTWPLAKDAGPDVEAVSWRLELGATLVRTAALRSLGTLDGAFEGATGAGIELGRRLIEKGAVVYHTPRLVADQRLLADRLSEHDRFVFLRRTFQRKWVLYSAVRRAIRTRRPVRVFRALRSSGTSVARCPPPVGADAVMTRPPAVLPPDPSVSVVLPTLGRYEMVAGVLEQLGRQTVPPRQVIVVDQNDLENRDQGFYDRFAETLPLEVVFQDERGQWISRNEAVRRTTGDWIAFVDDDSALVDDFIERHLEGLLRYDADLSTGASLAVVGAPVPENYSFFRVADQWDSGNGMCHRSLLERFGLFDEQFDRQRRGDAEFGLRVQLGGGLVVHVPGAIRTHLKAETGGLRTYGSWDGFRLRDRSGPLPLPAMLYYTKRYHTESQAREDLLIGLAQAIVPYELKRRATARQWAGFVIGEVLHLPSTVSRIRLSRRLAAVMTAEGPRVPSLVDR